MIRIYLTMRRGKLDKSEGLQLIAVLEKIRQAFLAEPAAAASIRPDSGRSASAMDWKDDPKYSRIRELLGALAGPRVDALQQAATANQPPPESPKE
jgi:hypothetical protein